MKYFSILFFVALILVTRESAAQNIEVISLKKGLEASGSVNVNTVGYKAFGLDQRRDPFNWFLTGNLNLTLFGYAAPFSFSVSNANKSFSQPFNQFHFAPQYKWIKTYTGNTSMTFSPYTLAGHMFLGGGVELTPGNWRISAMYGRLRAAVPYSTTDSLQHTNASFKRVGYGLKIGYETSGDAVSFSVFAAKDDPTSIPFVFPGSAITPQQNLAMSLGVRKKLFTKFFVDVEYGISVLNTNMLANGESRDSVRQTKNLLQGLLPENGTNRYFDAINTGIGYQGKQYTIQIRYERIAPEYQTLGAYFFNNDMRNITVAANVRLLNNKMTLSTNAGLQENNLDKTRTSTSSRAVGTLNLQFAPTERWNMSGNYSNFSTFTNVRPPSDPFFRNGLDTLNFYQVSETMGGTVTFSFGKNDAKQSLSVNGNYQKANNKAAGTGPSQFSDFINSSISYSYSFVPADLSLSIALTASTNSAAGITTSFFGPSINASKSLFDKMMRAAYATSYSQTSGGGMATSPVWNNQLNFSYAPKGSRKESDVGSGSKSNFGLGINMLRRLQGTEQQPAFTELTVTFNYSYSF